MFEMQVPELEKDIDLTKNYGKFVMEPLERGYGNTLGNALRRILLSSLPGAAATHIKIENVLHEFSTVEGVKEDVTEIILNIKKLAVRINSNVDENVIGKIRAKGPCELKAKDIMASSELEIFNPTLHIATLDEGAELNMDIMFGKGRGYKTNEENKEFTTEIGLIAVDSIYTPIRKVNYTVENTRVGQATDFEKLTLEVFTDGSIAPEEAVAIAGKIMHEHLQMFINLDDGVSSMKVLKQREENYLSEILILPIEELELGPRSLNALKRAKIETIGDLCQKTYEEVKKIKSLGEKSVEEIMGKLDARELKLKSEE